MNEVNNLLNRLGELDDAPLIWVNKKVYDMAEEIERLNNIINELEKWCIDYRENTGLDNYEAGLFDALGDVLDKIKELKGVDKE